MLLSPFSSQGIRKFKEIAQVCTSQKGQRWDTDPGLLDSNSVSYPWPLEEELGGLHLPSHAPAFMFPHLLPCTHTSRSSWSALSPPQAFTAPLAPTAPYHLPRLHTKARLPSLHGLQPQGPVLGLQHSKLVGSKALLTTGKALMILPTAKVLISFPPKPELKRAPTILKPRKVGLKL